MTTNGAEQPQNLSLPFEALPVMMCCDTAIQLLGFFSQQLGPTNLEASKVFQYHVNQLESYKQTFIAKHKQVVVAPTPQQVVDITKFPKK